MNEALPSLSWWFLIPPYKDSNSHTLFAQHKIIVVWLDASLRPSTLLRWPKLKCWVQWALRDPSPLLSFPGWRRSNILFEGCGGNTAAIFRQITSGRAFTLSLKYHFHWAVISVHKTVIWKAGSISSGTSCTLGLSVKFGLLSWKSWNSEDLKLEPSVPFYLVQFYWINHLSHRYSNIWQIEMDSSVHVHQDWRTVI